MCSLIYLIELIFNNISLYIYSDDLLDRFKLTFNLVDLYLILMLWEGDKLPISDSHISNSLC